MEWKEKPSRGREQSVQARVTTLAEANVTAMYPPRIWGTTFTGCYLYFKNNKDKTQKRWGVSSKVTAPGTLAFCLLTQHQFIPSEEASCSLNSPTYFTDNCFLCPWRDPKAPWKHKQRHHNNFQTPSQLCPDILTPLLLRPKSENCWDLTQRPQDGNKFLVLQQASSEQERKGMSWKEGPVACFRRRERTTTAEEQKHQSSSQMSCIGKTNYFTWIKQQIPKAVVLSQAPTKSALKFVGALNGQSQACSMPTKARMAHDDHAATLNINSTPPTHTLQCQSLKGLICFNFSCSPWFSSSS